MKQIPIVAIIGSRQCGKSTLAKYYFKSLKEKIILDLERPSDLRALNDPEAFFSINKKKIICIDEIQRKKELFSIIRYFVDLNIKNGQFLILGSASPELLKQSSESLAGRISYLNLTPFLFIELVKKNDIKVMRKLWLRGGYPRSYLSNDLTSSYDWRMDFIKTYLERDIPAFGFRLSSESMRRMWTMCAHLCAQILNYSKLGESLGVSHNTIKHYIDILVQKYMIRIITA